MNLVNVEGLIDSFEINTGGEELTLLTRAWVWRNAQDVADEASERECFG